MEVEIGSGVEVASEAGRWSVGTMRAVCPANGAFMRRCWCKPRVSKWGILGRVLTLLRITSYD